MNKIPRFMKEYANFQIREINENDLIQEKYKTYAIKRIKRALELCEKGMVSVNGTMGLINKIFEYMEEE